MYRKHASGKRDKREFNHTAKKLHKKNINKVARRGGIKL